MSHPRRAYKAVYDNLLTEVVPIAADALTLTRQAAPPCSSSASADALEELGDLALLLLAVRSGLALDPGGLDDAAVARGGAMAVPGLVRAQAGEHRAHDRRHLARVGLEVLRVVEHPQAA